MGQLGSAARTVPRHGPLPSMGCDHKRQRLRAIRAASLTFDRRGWLWFGKFDGLVSLRLTNPARNPPGLFSRLSGSGGWRWAAVLAAEAVVGGGCGCFRWLRVVQ